MYLDIYGHQKKRQPKVYKPKVNDKQQLFIFLYVKTGNAKQAYIEAGYRTKWPDRCASLLLQKPYIVRELDLIRKKVEKRQLVSFDDSVNMLKGIAVSGKEDRDKIAAIKEINGMYGYLAPVKTMNTNVSVDLAKVKELSTQMLLESQPIRDVIGTDKGNSDN